jgi:hypothetical protein
MSDFPQSVYQLLELIPAHGLAYRELSQDLRGNPLTIAQAKGLVDLEAPYRITPATLEAYGETQGAGVLLRITPAGKLALAEWQERRVLGLRGKRTGRPRKGESRKEQFVIGALVHHHGYQPGGSIENYEPAKVQQLADLASGEQVEVSVATVSRFFKRKFPNHDRGYDGYVAACNRDARLGIGMFLALWQNDVSERLAALLPYDGARED